MRNLHFVGVGVAIIAILIGCRSGIPSGMPPSGALPMGHARAASGDCTSGNLMVNIHVPSQSPATTIDVTDSIYDYAQVGGTCTLTVKNCQASSGGRLCTAHFSAPPAVNSIQIDAFKSGAKIASGAFPKYVPKSGAIATAVLGGSIASIAVVPFLSPPSPSPSPGNESTLPVGQTENVWIVAYDRHSDVIIGTYEPPIKIKSRNLNASSSELSKSSEGERFTIAWAQPLTINSPGFVIANASSITATAQINPSSGIVYHHVWHDEASLGAGPVAISPIDGSIYFVINDDSGCSKPGKCKGAVGRFVPPTSGSSGGFSPPIPMKDFPGISQLYFTSDGALWMATFQPVGSWNYPLRVLRMSPGGLSSPAPLPTSFGEASGFVEYPWGSGTLWISGCAGTSCAQHDSGTPIVIKTVAASPSPIATVDLPLSCAKFGYLGFSVGDIGYSGSRSKNVSLYVLGLNDGSAPPARGTIWQISPTHLTATCVHRIPKDFNPSAYFASSGYSSVYGALIFGAGANPDNLRWPPQHGFYSLSDGRLATPAPDLTPDATANHVSEYDGVVYYIHQANLASGIYVTGLGTFQPAIGEWNVFPSASFSGPQADDGVAAVTDGTSGAWFTADSVCSSPPPAMPWHGACLGRARYLSAWGLAPGLELPALHIGTGTGFGPIVNPSIVHSGPFYAQPDDRNVCVTSSPPPKSRFLFTVQGVKPGACTIMLHDTTQSVPLVTSVTPTPG
jgi:hypothetical protein